MKYIFSPRARKDVIQIWIRIARDSVTTADKVEEAIMENCQTLSDMPRAGHSRTDLIREGVLVWPALPYENYLIVYTIRSEDIYILRVLHGARRRVWKRGV